MIGHLHDGQVALRNAREQVRPARNAQVADADADERFFTGKEQHQVARDEHAGRKKKQRGQAAHADAHAEDVVDGRRVPLSPVLSP